MSNGLTDPSVFVNLVKTGLSRTGGREVEKSLEISKSVFDKKEVGVKMTEKYITQTDIIATGFRVEGMRRGDATLVNRRRKYAKLLSNMKK